MSVVYVPVVRWPQHVQQIPGMALVRFAMRDPDEVTDLLVPFEQLFDHPEHGTFLASEDWRHVVNDRIWLYPGGRTALLSRSFPDVKATCADPQSTGFILPKDKVWRPHELGAPEHFPEIPSWTLTWALVSGSRTEPGEYVTSRTVEVGLELSRHEGVNTTAQRVVCPSWAVVDGDTPQVLVARPKDKSTPAGRQRVAEAEGQEVGSYPGMIYSAVDVPSMVFYFVDKHVTELDLTSPVLAQRLRAWALDLVKRKGGAPDPVYPQRPQLVSSSAESPAATEEALRIFPLPAGAFDDDDFQRISLVKTPTELHRIQRQIWWETAGDSRSRTLKRGDWVFFHARFENDTVPPVVRGEVCEYWDEAAQEIRRLPLGGVVPLYINAPSPRALVLARIREDHSDPTEPVRLVVTAASGDEDQVEISASPGHVWHAARWEDDRGPHWEKHREPGHGIPSILRTYTRLRAMHQHFLDLRAKEELEDDWLFPARLYVEPGNPALIRVAYPSGPEGAEQSLYWGEASTLMELSQPEEWVLKREQSGAQSSLPIWIRSKRTRSGQVRLAPAGALISVPPNCLFKVASNPHLAAALQDGKTMVPVEARDYRQLMARSVPDAFRVWIPGWVRAGEDGKLHAVVQGYGGPASGQGESWSRLQAWRSFPQELLLTEWGAHNREQRWLLRREDPVEGPWDGAIAVWIRGNISAWIPCDATREIVSVQCAWADLDTFHVSEGFLVEEPSGEPVHEEGLTAIRRLAVDGDMLFEAQLVCEFDGRMWIKYQSDKDSYCELYLGSDPRQLARLPIRLREYRTAKDDNPLSLPVWVMGRWLEADAVGGPLLRDRAYEARIMLDHVWEDGPIYHGATSAKVAPLASYGRLSPAVEKPQKYLELTSPIPSTLVKALTGPTRGYFLADLRSNVNGWSLWFRGTGVDGDERSYHIPLPGGKDIAWETLSWLRLNSFQDTPSESVSVLLVGALTEDPRAPGAQVFYVSGLPMHISLSGELIDRYVHVKSKLAYRTLRADDLQQLQHVQSLRQPAPAHAQTAITQGVLRFEGQGRISLLLPQRGPRGVLAGEAVYPLPRAEDPFWNTQTWIHVQGSRDRDSACLPVWVRGSHISSDDAGTFELSLPLLGRYRASAQLTELAASSYTTRVLCNPRTLVRPKELTEHWRQEVFAAGTVRHGDGAFHLKIPGVRELVVWKSSPEEWHPDYLYTRVPDEVSSTEDLPVWVRAHLEFGSLETGLHPVTKLCLGGWEVAQLPDPVRELRPLTAMSLVNVADAWVPAAQLLVPDNQVSSRALSALIKSTTLSGVQARSRGLLYGYLRVDAQGRVYFNYRAGTPEGGTGTQEIFLCWASLWDALGTAHAARHATKTAALPDRVDARGRLWVWLEIEAAGLGERVEALRAESTLEESGSGVSVMLLPFRSTVDVDVGSISVLGTDVALEVFEQLDLVSRTELEAYAQMPEPPASSAAPGSFVRELADQVERRVAAESLLSTPSSPALEGLISVPDGAPVSGYEGDQEIPLAEATSVTQTSNPRKVHHWSLRDREMARAESVPFPSRLFHETTGLIRGWRHRDTGRIQVLDRDGRYVQLSEVPAVPVSARDGATRKPVEHWEEVWLKVNIEPADSSRPEGVGHRHVQVQGHPAHRFPVATRYIYIGVWLEAEIVTAEDYDGSPAYADRLPVLQREFLLESLTDASGGDAVEGPLFFVPDEIDAQGFGLASMDPVVVTVPHNTAVVSGPGVPSLLVVEYNTRRHSVFTRDLYTAVEIPQAVLSAAEYFSHLERVDQAAHASLVTVEEAPVPDPNKTAEPAANAAEQNLPEEDDENDEDEGLCEVSLTKGENDYVIKLYDMFRHALRSWPESYRQGHFEGLAKTIRLAFHPTPAEDDLTLEELHVRGWSMDGSFRDHFIALIAQRSLVLAKELATLPPHIFLALLYALKEEGLVAHNGAPNERVDAETWNLAPMADLSDIDSSTKNTQEDPMNPYANNPYAAAAAPVADATLFNGDPSQMRANQPNNGAAPEAAAPAPESSKSLMDMLTEVLNSDPTLSMVADAGPDAGKMVAAMKSQGLFQQITRVVVQHFFGSESLVVLDTPLGKVLQDTLTPLAIHFAFSRGWGREVPGADLICETASAAFRGRLVLIGFEYVPELSQVYEAISGELDGLRNIGKMLRGAAAMSGMAASGPRAIPDALRSTDGLGVAARVAEPVRSSG